ncbi:MAG TPA: hypothetical protein VN672_11405 [Solirubrobacteraceae bacterium]|nr:hypothetical protein [Solirubrobacteraceae bacterium]
MTPLDCRIKLERADELLGVLLVEIEKWIGFGSYASAALLASIRKGVHHVMEVFGPEFDALSESN